jgi:hypothetical protein
MSDRYEGGILSGTAPTVTQQGANGVYTLSQELQYQGQGVWPAAAQTPILKSLRFRSSASAYLNRTPSSTGSQTTFTWSGWLKRGTLGVRQSVFSSGASNSNALDIYFTSSDTLTFEEYNVSTNYYNRTSAVYRDPAAWYHIVVAVDSTQATSSNRVKMYVNGSQITAFSTALYPTQNFAYQINTSSYPARISNGTLYASEYFDGYQAEVNFIDGVQLTPSSFGTTDVNGIWQPIPYTGAYGTNGFYLKFNNTTSTSTLGNDSSGNGNNWTVNNISLTAGTTYDSMLDSPSNASSTIANYAVLNPLTPTYGSTLSNGNLRTSGPSGIYSTIAFPSTGSWYVELNTTTVVGFANGFVFGIATEDSSLYTWIRASANQVTTNLGTVTFNSYSNFASGNTAAIAYNASTGVVSYYKNNTLAGTVTGFIPTKPVFIYVGGDDAGDVLNANFGQQPFAYTPPTGFNRLNTYNLPVPTIPAGNKVMDATIYTGDGTNKSITNSGSFKPDLVWVKSRSNAEWNILFDSVRGTGKSIYSNDTNAEVTNAGNGYVSAFNSNGYAVTAGSTSIVNVNGNTYTYVGWQWQAGQGTTSSNTDGTITSTVSVNTTAGFSIVTYTGNGTSGATVGHGLGVTPSMIIIKNRGTSAAWAVNHTSIGATQYLNLNATGAVATDTTVFQGRNATTFQIGTDGWVNLNTYAYVAYCFAPVAGFSAFGSYVGNGSDDGPFIYCGFRPKFIFRKCSSTAGENSMQYDTSMNPYNQAPEWLSPNLDAASNVAGGYYIDFVSNGVKIRHAATGNNSGRTYIYMAFAENPFKIARAR